MALTTGTRLGPYEITAQIGVGGMGEVWCATDVNLGRQVAIKVLPDAFAQDPDRLARFEREAKTLASLNHPNIAIIHGLEKAAGIRALVMELVEGPTLADRIAHGPIRIEEALAASRQIVEALEAAHEKGIVHRDLKPANIKITAEGRVKVLDFGLARLQDRNVGEGIAPPPNVTQSPTLSLMATQAGMILGTAGYMSPEQAKGLAADHRSDLFSFGVVLYEMLTGRRLFQADTVAETMAAVLMREPDLSSLPANLNPRVADLLRRCLEKNLRRRWQAAGDLGAELESVSLAPFATPRTSVRPISAQPMWRRLIPFVATAILAAAITAGLLWASYRAPVSPPLVRFSIPLTDVVAIPARFVALSRDGTRLVYSTGALWLRELSSAEPKQIPGTERMLITEPAFSPDGKALAFFSATERALKRIDLDTGRQVTLAQVEQRQTSITWAQSGIVFTQEGRILRISPDGGMPETIVTLGADERAHAPQLLPDGKTLLYTILRGTGRDAWERGELVAQPLGSGSRKTLTTGTDSRYVPSGHLVFTRGTALLAARFDVDRLELTSEPVLVDGIRRIISGAGAPFDVSDTGSLAYFPGLAEGSSSEPSELVSVDENSTLNALKLPAGQYGSPRISPDGSRLAFDLVDGQETNIWVYDLDGSTARRRLTFRGNNRIPVWSADGHSLAFQSDRDGDLAIFRQPADVSGDAAERITKPDRGTAHIPESWSRQDHLLFSAVDGATARLWSLSINDRKPAPFRDVSSSNALNAEFSPDGRWVAYTQRGGSLITMIYVEPFPPTGERLSITRADDVGHHVMWSRDGNALFYVPGAQSLTAVRVVKKGTSLSVGEPQAWPGKLANVNPFGAPRNFDIWPDGKRFIFVRPAGLGQTDANGGPRIDVVVNWLEELRARLPAQ